MFLKCLNIESVMCNMLLIESAALAVRQARSVLDKG